MKVGFVKVDIWGTGTVGKKSAVIMGKGCNGLLLLLLVVVNCKRVTIDTID